jgi:uncharacterized protein YndB with AHSA1/START domain
MAYDWSSFTKSITIKSNAEKLYTAFATKDGMESWFLRSCEFKHPGGTLLTGEEPVKQDDEYTWMWDGYPDEVNEHGKILKANGRDLFEFTFNANASNNMIVEVNIKEEHEECMVSLRQYNIPTDEAGKTNFHLGCAEGWIFYLANLKSILEGGIDLRNKNPDIQKVINS